MKDCPIFSRKSTLLLLLSGLWGPGEALCQKSNQEVELTIQRSVQVTFDSEEGKGYQAYSSMDVEDNWQPLGDEIPGSGGTITIFYNVEPIFRRFENWFWSN